MEFISFGAGVNSVALLLWLRDQGNDAEAVFADHHCDWPETYRYVDYLESQGYHITRLDVGDLYEWFWRKATIPMRQARWCTRDFKIAPLTRYMRIRSGGEWTTYIGFAFDEAHRFARARCAPGETKVAPLVDHGITRADCIAIIRDHGLEVPPKSGCWFCPFQRKAEYLRLRHEHPELICRIAALEDRANESLARRKPGSKPFYIKDRPILEFVGADQPDLFDNAPPCVCML